jgi:hypothetical protein
MSREKLSLPLNSWQLWGQVSKEDRKGVCEETMIFVLGTQTCKRMVCSGNDEK